MSFTAKYTSTEPIVSFVTIAAPSELCEEPQMLSKIEMMLRAGLLLAFPPNGAWDRQPPPTYAVSCGRNFF
jgi:hypothetical protein